MSSLSFDEPAPRAADLSRRWHAALADAEPIIATLPAPHVGQAVVTPDGRLSTESASALEQALGNGGVTFHPGRIGGAWPTVKS